jgi:hypothetical protein
LQGLTFAKVRVTENGDGKLPIFAELNTGVVRYAFALQNSRSCYGGEDPEELRVLHDNGGLLTTVLKWMRLLVEREEVTSTRKSEC